MVVTLNEREQKLIQVAWQCMDVQPKIDYEKLAQLSGLGTRGSATTAWCVLKKKLTAGGDSISAGSSPSRAATPKPTTPRKRKAGAGARTPASAKRSKVGYEEGSVREDEDDDEELENSQVEKRGKKMQEATLKTDDAMVVVDHGQVAEMGGEETAGCEEKRVKLEEEGEEPATFLKGLHEAAAGAV